MQAKVLAAQQSLPSRDLRTDIRRALTAAQRRIRWASAWHLAASTFSIAVLLSASWIAAQRFSLLDLPSWPPLIVMALWLAAVVLASLRKKVSSAEAAQYLDARLGLDERLTTYVEIAFDPRGGRTGQRSDIAGLLLSEAVGLIKLRGRSLPGLFAWKPDHHHVFGLILSLALLLGVILLPSPFDEQRREMAVLRQTVAGQLSELEKTSASISANPDITGAAKASLLSEIAATSQRLQTANLDRAGMVAALSEAEERLQHLSSAPASDFASLTKAAQLVWQVAVRTTDWAVDAAAGMSDFGKASDAAAFFSSSVREFTSEESDQIASALRLASAPAGIRHPLIAESLRASADALHTRSYIAARDSLSDVSRLFSEADRQHQTAQSLETTLSKLEDAKQAVAQAGIKTEKKPQVGFRRREPAAVLAGTPSVPTELDDPGSAGRSPANSPDGRGTPVSSAATPGSTSQSGSANNQPSGQTGRAVTPGAAGGIPSQGSGSPKSGVPKAGSPDQGQGPSGSNVSRPGGGGSDDSRKGTLQGPISGPVGSSSGAISKVENPQGNGSTTDSASNGSGANTSQDEVYVPAPQSSTGSISDPGGEQSGVKSNPSRTGGSGTSDNGDAASNGSVGTGQITKIRTPYTEVIAQYAEQATQALDRAYIPGDAKEYVKQYFTLLGK